MHFLSYNIALYNLRAWRWNEVLLRVGYVTLHYSAWQNKLLDSYKVDYISTLTQFKTWEKIKKSNYFTLSFIIFKVNSIDSWWLGVDSEQVRRTGGVIESCVNVKVKLTKYGRIPCRSPALELFFFFFFFFLGGGGASTRSRRAGMMIGQDSCCQNDNNHLKASSLY